MSNRGRPPKKPEDRRTTDVKIPLTEAEKLLIKQAAEADEMRHVVWARDILIRAAKRRVKG